MSQIASNANVFSTLSSNSAGRSTDATTSLNDVNLDDFLNLMIAELQNQDPLNPLENDQLVAQISQIRQVGATDKLTSTLDAVLLGQNISSATNLIGAEIDALSDDNQRVSGVVGRVSVAGGQPKLHLDLNPRATASSEPGSIEKGNYEYLVTWQEEGTLFGVDPLAGQPLALQGEPGVDAAVQISNLPKSPSPKQVYRRDAGAGGAFRLVDTLSDGAQSRYVDTKSGAELSQLTLTGTPQMVTSQRTFEVSLKNVAEIRPPN